MEFRKLLMITLYAEQKKRHRCIEQSFGLCGRRRGWDVSKEQHRNVYCLGWNRSPAQGGCMRQALRPGALGRPWGMGNTCKPMADSFQCMTKPTAIKKKKLKKKIWFRDGVVFIVRKIYLPWAFRWGNNIHTYIKKFSEVSSGKIIMWSLLG